jgi:hypothetical protein
MFWYWRDDLEAIYNFVIVDPEGKDRIHAIHIERAKRITNPLAPKFPFKF